MKNFHNSEKCPVRTILSRIGDKWSILVISTLDSNGIMRFNEIHKSIGDISHRMLTVTLRTLEDDGLVVRKVYPEVPPRVEYTLTKTGESLLPHIYSLLEWADENMETIVQARKTNKK